VFAKITFYRIFYSPKRKLYLLKGSLVFFSQSYKLKKQYLAFVVIRLEKLKFYKKSSKEESLLLAKKIFYKPKKLFKIL
jgi:hypothetical protein